MFLQRELFKYVSHVQFVELDEIADALKIAETLPPSSVNAMIDASLTIAQFQTPMAPVRSCTSLQKSIQSCEEK